MTLLDSAPSPFVISVSRNLVLPIVHVVFLVDSFRQKNELIWRQGYLRSARAAASSLKEKTNFITKNESNISHYKQVICTTPKKEEEKCSICFVPSLFSNPHSKSLSTSDTGMRNFVTIVTGLKSPFNPNPRIMIIRQFGLFAESSYFLSNFDFCGL